MDFPPLQSTDHAVVSVSIDFPSNTRGNVPFYCTAYDYSRADWNGLRDHLRDIHRMISLNSVLLQLVLNFVSGSRLELMCISSS